MSISYLQKEFMILTYIRRLKALVTYTFLFIFSHQFFFLEANLPQLDTKNNPFAMDLNNLPKNGLMPMPTAEEMKEIEQFLSTLSESEIEELIKYGENITKIAEENNIPLFFEPPPSDNGGIKPVPTPSSSTKPTDTKTKDKTAPVVITKDDITYYKKILEDFLSIIQTIRQRLSTVRNFNTILQPLLPDIELLVYYLHFLQKEHVMLHLKDKKYESLVEIMNKNQQLLNDLNDSLELPSVEALNRHPMSAITKKELKNAEKIVNAIQKRFESMLQQDSLISIIESLLKEYEPVALQIKQKNEEKEKTAHEAVKKIPVTNIAKPIPVAPAYSQPYQGPRPYTPAVPPIKNAPAAQPQKPLPNNDQKLKVVEPVKKSDPQKNKKTTLAELEREIITLFDSVEQRLVPHRANINNFLTTYETTKAEPEHVTTALNEANFGLKKVKGLVDEWYKKLEKEATSKTDMENKSKGLRETFKNNMRHNNLKTIHAKTKSMAKTNAEGSVKRFKEMMDAIEKRIIDIF